MISILLFALTVGQDSIPYKPSDEFELKLDYEFKTRPAHNANEFKYEELSKDKRKGTSISPLPYLKLDLQILKASADEERIIGFRNGVQYFNKRGLKSGTQIEIEMGYTDDMKDRITPHEYIIVLARKDKSETSRIVIFIGEDGEFLVNGEKRGGF